MGLVFGTMAPDLQYGGDARMFAMTMERADGYSALRPSPPNGMLQHRSTRDSNHRITARPPLPETRTKRQVRNILHCGVPDLRPADPDAGLVARPPSRMPAQRSGILRPRFRAARRWSSGSRPGRAVAPSLEWVASVVAGQSCEQITALPKQESLAVATIAAPSDTEHLHELGEALHQQVGA